jgi:hypothetical protein
LQGGIAFFPGILLQVIGRMTRFANNCGNSKERNAATQNDIAAGNWKWM